MIINKVEPIRGLKKVISKLFNVKFPNSDYAKYPEGLPKALQDMYEIEAHFSKARNHKTLPFFSHQDRLIPFAQLDLTEKTFEFLWENQNNWVCEAELKTSKVYLRDRVEPYNSHYLTQKLPDFLMTFGLQAVGFNLENAIGLEAKTMADIESNFNTVEHLWTGKHLTNAVPFSFYLVDDDCFVMWAGMAVFATNNQEKFEHYKGVLTHYRF